ncbi:uncharacterized protein LOC125675474 [Ostrea edulis]|uniref:uncharacterized protein LOC125675474 n=1 Tax=Ostrea edulis TaxID=37623 RepID=UPI0024AF0BBC|nr:uncharacterized protein LOC125675474 [Ostrea edulis]
MGEIFDEITDESLFETFNRIKQKFKGHEVMKEGFYELRDAINDIVKACSKNVKVVVYVNDVLDEPIIVQSGSGENRLRITIKGGGRISYSWTKETCEKVFRDAWSVIIFSFKNFLGLLPQSQYGDYNFYPISM